MLADVKVTPANLTVTFLKDFHKVSEHKDYTNSLSESKMNGFKSNHPTQESLFFSLTSKAQSFLCACLLEFWSSTAPPEFLI